ncbi:hypothetical protein J6590_055083 [Homalodisca vitripennis]|nr:hypothetical protein J6590_055083 [Homalodisca vitripennis]
MPRLINTQRLTALRHSKLITYYIATSLLNYESIFSESTSKSSVNKVFIIQRNNAIGVFVGLKIRDSCRGDFPADNILFVPRKIILAISVLILKSLPCIPVADHPYRRRSKL